MKTAIRVLFYFITSFLLLAINVCAQPIIKVNVKEKTDKDIINGVEKIDSIIYFVATKNVGIVANQTSIVGKQNIVDTLIKRKVKLIKIFCPEHGFRGDADAGEDIVNSVDKKTNLPVISLYGKNKKPTLTDLKGIDIMLFDLQDVGTRFFTYISTLNYVMEACAENHIPLIVLDRPNPNGFFVDGPVLKEECKSYVGLHPVPIVYGMTIGEYALMINGEGWLANKVKCDLKVMRCRNYGHDDYYILPVKPSPNLPNKTAIYLYPSLCLFEGTVISVGRGTDKPFQQVGHPDLKEGTTTFTPKSIVGASKNPPYKDRLCHGYNLQIYGDSIIRYERKLNLLWISSLYQSYTDKEHFFNDYFDSLAGNHELQKQIKEGMSEEAIRKTWQRDIDRFKTIRRKYLLYKDFE